MIGTIRFDEIADAWKQDPEFRAEYQRVGPAMELAFALSEARREAQLTQAEVSRRMGTSQAAIARLEGGSVKPTWETVERYAQAIGRRAIITLEPIDSAR